MRFREHRPGSVDLSTPPEEYTADTEHELLNLPQLRRWRDMDGFYRFESSGDATTLMAIFKEGAEWWVVGYADEPFTTIPRWTHPND